MPTLVVEAFLFSPNSPVTSEGVTSNATPLPLLTLILTGGNWPPVVAESEAVVHCVANTDAVKLPLLCANAALPATNVANTAIVTPANNRFTMENSSSSDCFFDAI
jgi:hypothetical protein